METVVEDKVETQGAEETLPKSEQTLKEMQAMAERLESGQPAEKIIEDKIEEQPEEKKEAVTTEVSEEDDSSVPKELRDKPWWLTERESKRKLRQEKEDLARQKQELEARLAEVEKAKDKTRSETQPARDQHIVDDVFSLHVKALNKEFEGDPNRGLSAEDQNTKVLAHTAKAINEEFTTEEILEVIQRAENGYYGQANSEILRVANNALSRMTAKQAIEQRRVEQQREQMRQVQQEELRYVVKNYPQFSKTDSPEFKHIDVWQKRWVGEVDASGNIIKPGLLDISAARYVMDHPRLMAEMVLQDYKSSTYETMKNDYERLKSQNERTRQPVTGGKPPSQASEELKGSSRIEAELREKFGELE